MDKSDRCMPIEGAFYSSSSGSFQVVAVGLQHGYKIFVIKVGDEFCVYRLNGWKVIFPDARLEEIEILDCTIIRAIYFGHLCEMRKLPDGEIQFVNSQRGSEWIIKHPSPTRH